MNYGQPTFPYGAPSGAPGSSFPYGSVPPATAPYASGGAPPPYASGYGSGYPQQPSPQAPYGSSAYPPTYPQAPATYQTAYNPSPYGYQQQQQPAYPYASAAPAPNVVYVTVPPTPEAAPSSFAPSQPRSSYPSDAQLAASPVSYQAPTSGPSSYNTQSYQQPQTCPAPASPGPAASSAPSAYQSRAYQQPLTSHPSASPSPAPSTSPAPDRSVSPQPAAPVEEKPQPLSISARDGSVVFGATDMPTSGAALEAQLSSALATARSLAEKAEAFDIPAFWAGDPSVRHHVCATIGSLLQSVDYVMARIAHAPSLSDVDAGAADMLSESGQDVSDMTRALAELFSHTDSFDGADGLVSVTRQKAEAILFGLDSMGACVEMVVDDMGIHSTGPVTNAAVPSGDNGNGGAVEPSRADGGTSETTLSETSKRARVLREILDTERVYVTNLSLCINTFLVPLRASCRSPGSVVSASDVAAIFSTLEIIWQVNSSVLSVLEKRMEGWPVVHGIGEVFVKMTPMMKYYTTYVNAFDRSASVLGEHLKDTRFAEKIAQLRSDANLPLDLGSYLIQPVQRLPRYELLLRELLRALDEEEDDAEMRAGLERAMMAVTSVNQYINERKRKVEGQVILEQVAKRIHKAPFSLVRQHRRFVRECRSVQLSRSAGQDKPVQLVAILFSDLLVVGKSKRKDEMQYEDAMSLDSGVTVATQGANALLVRNRVKEWVLSGMEDVAGWKIDLQDALLKLHYDAEAKRKQGGHVCALKIQEAQYGLLQSARKTLDVTVALQDIVRAQGGTSLTLQGDTSKASLPGFHDPQHGGQSKKHPNMLRITWSCFDVDHSRTFEDTERVRIVAVQSP